LSPIDDLSEPSVAAGVERTHAPDGIDTSVAHSARVYDWWLGGKDNFPIDRIVGAAIAEAIPSIREMAKANRDFMHRSARYLARECGIRQFLDIGTGIPTSPNLHEVVQEVAPESRIVYVDNDPIVLVHARALMTSDPRGQTEYIQADVREAAKILEHPGLVGILDRTQPVGLALIAVLMLFRDEENPWELTRGLMDALPSGSYLVISHPALDFDPEAMATVIAAAEQGGLPFVPRTGVDVARFFEGWELVDPGVVPVLTWRPDGPEPADPNAAYYWAGVARKP
jgi:hypothetical protein